MKMQITATTDHQYIETIFEDVDNPVLLGEGIANADSTLPVAQSIDRAFV